MPRAKKVNATAETVEIAPMRVPIDVLKSLETMFVANDLMRPGGPVRIAVQGFDVDRPFVVVDIQRGGADLHPVRILGYTLDEVTPDSPGGRQWTSGDGYQGLHVTWEGKRYITGREVVFEIDEPETLWRIHGRTMRDELRHSGEAVEGDYDEAKYAPYHLFLLATNAAAAISMMVDGMDGGYTWGEYSTSEAEPATFDQIPESEIGFYRRLADTDEDAIPAAHMYARLIEQYDAWASTSGQGAYPTITEAMRTEEGRVKIARALANAAGAPELPLLRRSRREVNVELDTAQILELSEQAATVNGEKVAKEREKKDFDKEIGDEIKELELRENALQKTLRDKFTIDVIEVDERADYEHGIVRVFRTGTDEQIDSRALTHEERQTAMHFDDIADEDAQARDENSAAFVPDGEIQAAGAIPVPCVYCDDQEGGCAECKPTPTDDVAEGEREYEEHIHAARAEAGLSDPDIEALDAAVDHAEAVVA